MYVHVCHPIEWYLFNRLPCMYMCATRSSGTCFNITVWLISSLRWSISASRNTFSRFAITSLLFRAWYYCSVHIPSNTTCPLFMQGRYINKHVIYSWYHGRQRGASFISDMSSTCRDWSSAGRYMATKPCIVHFIKHAQGEHEKI